MLIEQNEVTLTTVSLTAASLTRASVTKVSPASIRRCLQLLLPLLLMTFINSSAFAQEELAVADAVVAEDAEATAFRALEISRELNARQQAIEDLQGEQGIYSPFLQEAYSDLAAFYNEIEDYENAISLYTDALQVTRINTGLYSEEQLPVIQALIRGNDKLQQWQDLDDLQQLIYHISSRLYQPGDPGYFGAAEQYGRWKLRMMRENLLGMNYRRLTNTAVDLSKFYDSVIANIESQPDARPDNLSQMIVGKMQADLILARAVASTPYTAFEGTASRFITQTRCQNVRNSQGQIVRQCVSVQVENPRYRQSQRDAKQFAMSRHNRAIRGSLDKLQSIRSGGSGLNAAEVRALDTQIAQIEAELAQLLRLNRRRSLF